MNSTERIAAASEELLKLSEEMRRLGVELRDCASLGEMDYAYARTYNLRKDLGKVVATLGVGVPRKVNK